MTHDLKFIVWKVAELIAFVIALPFLFVGGWVGQFSNWCRDRAKPHDRRV